MRLMRQKPRLDADYAPMLGNRMQRISYYWDDEDESHMKHDNIFSCVCFSGKKVSNRVTILVGEERQVFQVEQQILDHGLVQCLLEKTRSTSDEESDMDAYENSFNCTILKGRKSEASRTTARIYPNCDAILFDHILWLLYNDDPSIRYLNLDELMEFYC
ncbi:hypothetical protein O6H91_14G030700 [Diphasiastrum complanatum]|uniref:Uncharacterized protein n=1 Tax=Diphasiastrum complanatum TaxID=34168 RepID=A0ACC2BMS9_DIPCM|nr:hypothetical protein O6H91_14G030700 [Diphasiastrum complanatum]